MRVYFHSPRFLDISSGPEWYGDGVGLTVPYGCYSIQVLKYKATPFANSRANYVYGSGF